MAAPDNSTPVTINGGIVKTPLPATPSNVIITTTDGSNQNSSDRRLCFAPTEQAHNHGSDRARPLRTMPFDPEIWIGNLEDLGRRVWPHPSYKELIARSLTGDPKFALPDTVAKKNRFRSLRLRCCGDGCDQTTHGSDVEYEKPSRLETLAFGQTQNVIIYPFYMGLSELAAPQKLFAIVHRHETGGYRFWKADGTYHESYGLAKGSASVSSPRSARSANIGSLGSSKGQLTSTPTKSGRSAAQLADDLDTTPLRVVQKMRMLTRSRDMSTHVADGQTEDPLTNSSEPQSKRRLIARRHPATVRPGPKLGKPGARRPAKTTTWQSQSGFSSTQQPSRRLLHIKEICMLAYHLNGPTLKLMYGNDGFTVESGEGSLIDPTTQNPFLMTGQHAQYLLYSRQQSLKVVVSNNATRNIHESPDEITGGIILLEFGGSSARDEFIARIGQLIRGSINWKNDSSLELEPMYQELLEQLNTRRTAAFEAQQENTTTSHKSTEQTKLFVVKNESEVEGGEVTSCPTVVTETSLNDALATPGVPQFATLPTTQTLRGTLRSSIPVKASKSPDVPEIVAVDLTASSISQAQDTSATMLSEPKNPNSEMTMKKELQDLLREMYIKYPGAQDDVLVEEMALSLKVSLLGGDEERVRELKRELKVYLIAHHGWSL
ncbi:hypothetical protein M436DRAFT_68909 [Aureobasidium namibiae CBS 147.97]|uniref:Uncharacterized protein n=1 Tax=Aureobasidium namibiae CBS 147.97 TaxID=1043004 RepID=A0A074WX31_9PEZI